MKKKRALSASRMPDDYDTQQGDGSYVIRDPAQQPNTIVFNTTTGLDGEMLRVSREGFWVRGVKVAQDEREAEIVYNAFREWMTWAALTRQY